VRKRRGETDKTGDWTWIGSLKRLATPHSLAHSLTLVPSAGSVTLVTRQRPEAHCASAAQAGALLAGSHSGSATVAAAWCQVEGTKGRGSVSRSGNPPQPSFVRSLRRHLRSQASPLAHS
jgi:Flp pilus assembly protein CpaB